MYKQQGRRNPGKGQAICDLLRIWDKGLPQAAAEQSGGGKAERCGAERRGTERCSVEQQRPQRGRPSTTCPLLLPVNSAEIINFRPRDAQSDLPGGRGIKTRRRAHRARASSLGLGAYASLGLREGFATPSPGQPLP